MSNLNSQSNVVLRFSDEIVKNITVAPGETILDAAIAQDAPVFYQCQSGSCSSCLAHLQTGDAKMRSGQASVLLASEIADGQRLLCRTEVSGDCELTLDYSSTAAGNGPSKAQAFIDKVTRIAPDAMQLTIELAEGDWMDFKPGQYIQVKVPGTDEWRSYSIASKVDDLPVIELLIRLLPNGKMSEWLTSTAAVDQPIELEGPFGHFFLNETARAPHIMIAGGTGLAPMMAMIDTIRARSGKKPPMALSFGCASPEGLFFCDELALRQDWMPNLDVRLSVDQGQASSTYRIGNPVEAIVQEDITDTETVAYLCGPPGMIEAARAHLISLGVKPNHIHAEQFVAS